MKLKTMFTVVSLALAATLSGQAFAQGMGMKGDPAQMQARMQQRMAERQAQLKAKLGITADQEAAWSAWTTAMQPPANMGQWRIDPAEMEKLTTPQRIERRQQMMAQRMSAMNARAEATKTFYNALRPEQRTIFDQQTARGGHRGGAMGGDNPGAGHRHG